MVEGVGRDGGTRVNHPGGIDWFCVTPPTVVNLADLD